MASELRFAGTGIRERLLRLIGSGDLYDQLRGARSDCSQMEERLRNLEFENRHLTDLINQSSPEQQDLGAAAPAKSTEVTDLERLVAHFDRGMRSNKIIELEYPANPRVRHGWGSPDEPLLSKIIAKGRDRYIDTLQSFLPLLDQASKIGRTSNDPLKPQWSNDWFPPFDAISLYGFLATRNPSKLVEIGSGTSSKFARQAINDFGLRTQIVSIDPQPRSEIDDICDTVLRFPLEDAPMEHFESLTCDDIVFFDGSHRSFQNSDVTVFFTEILPLLPSGLLVGIHDIFLPADYPPEWLKRFYSEQYLLACWLLAGERLQVELPIWYCSADKAILSLMDRLWGSPNLADCKVSGGAFWFTVK